MLTTETPLEDLLLTNDVPTDIQRSSAQIFLEKNQSRLSEVDADLTRLRLEREAISAYVQRYEVLLSSARRVLNIPELIGEILHQCIPNTVASGEFQHLPKLYCTDRLDIPLALSHVCSIWRRVALATPKLWAAFTVTAHDRLTVLVNLRLSRSKSHPLSFGIHLGDIRSTIYDSPVVAALSRNKIRWKNVFVNGSTIKDFLSYVSDTYPILETLHLCGTSLLETHIFAPNLTQLEIRGRVLVSDKSSLPNLRELILHDEGLITSLACCLSMCRRYPTLERAVFSISPTATLSSDEDIVLLPTLKDLHLSIISRHDGVLPDASPLLMKIRAPVLNKLNIESKIRATLSIREIILPFLKQSNDSLTALHLEGGYSDMDSLVEFLEHLPHLQELSLSSRHLNSDDLLTHLQKRAVKQTSTVLCAPELVIIGPLRPNPTLALMVDFILSRSSNDACSLREVVMPSQETADDLRSHPGISECITNGLRVLTREFRSPSRFPNDQFLHFDVSVGKR
ncbi:hypothetical protein BD410DRAFT_841135 [Rickenella mellea]|uniref:F-box domain-containing protein n=1 Tax=Rickenella mellea TaxID=50990 RepID=A0A4Y7PZX3_9AGAM|nr:hypothetical protein BD410DRAFT_841135 [Rickenella mellea]